MLAVLLASVTACSLGGCAGKKKDTVRTVKIGLTLYDQYDTFISELVSWFNASASALEEETGTAINVESALHCYRTIYRFMAKNYKQVEDTIVLGWKVELHLQTSISGE